METGQPWSPPAGQVSPVPPPAGAPTPGVTFGGFGQPPLGTPLPPPAPARPSGSGNQRRVIAICVVIAVLIVGAIIGNAIAGKTSIAVGDCVQTTPSVTHGWDIGKVDCNQQYGFGASVYKVDTVQDGSDGNCYGDSETTFNDDPAGKTYCLSMWLGRGD